MNASKQCQIANYIDVINSTELVQICISTFLTVVLIIFIMFQLIKKKVVKYIQGKERTVVKLIIISSLLACIFYFLNNIFSIIEYFVVYQKNPNIVIKGSKNQYIYKIQQASVWLVPFFINNFFMLIGYLWHILMTKFFESNQNGNRIFFIIIIILNILEISLLIVSRILDLQQINDDVKKIFSTNITVLPFTVISALTLIFSSIKFMRKLEFITQIKNKKKFIIKTFFLVLASLIRIAFNIYSYKHNQFGQAKLNDKKNECIRNNGHLYGIILLGASISMIIMPIFVANTMFHKEVKDKIVIINRMESSLFQDSQQIL